MDEKNPDFEIKYEAGAAPQAATSAQPYMVNGGTPGPAKLFEENVGFVPETL